MKALDLFCKAGGTGMGLHRAGFEVTGVDIEPQKRYPFEFVLGDALEYVAQHGHEYDLVVAGPPCQLYSKSASLTTKEYPDLVGPTRSALQATSKPYIIENVPGAPLANPIMLCGTMFPELRVIRHRLFECWPVLWWPPAPCNHWSKISYNGFCTLFGKGASKEKGGNKDMWQRASGIDWMPTDELSQAIPPAYTEWLGRQMLRLI